MCVTGRGSVSVSLLSGDFNHFFLYCRHKTWSSRTSGNTVTDGQQSDRKKCCWLSVEQVLDQWGFAVDRARQKTANQLTNKVPLVKLKSTNNHAAHVTRLQSVVNVVLWRACLMFHGPSRRQIQKRAVQCFSNKTTGVFQIHIPEDERRWSKHELPLRLSESRQSTRRRVSVGCVPLLTLSALLHYYMMLRGTWKVK